MMTGGCVVQATLYFISQTVTNAEIYDDIVLLADEMKEFKDFMREWYNAQEL